MPRLGPPLKYVAKYDTLELIIELPVPPPGRLSPRGGARRAERVPVVLMRRRTLELPLHLSSCVTVYPLPLSLGATP